ncbi:hypothetical protein D3C75_1030760 [compost metagenome]
MLSLVASVVQQSDHIMSPFIRYHAEGSRSRQIRVRIGDFLEVSLLILIGFGHVRVALLVKQAGTWHLEGIEQAMLHISLKRTSRYLFDKEAG